ncbi:MauE/DoxX family redox-associated membrane protein [Rubellicoccus peritrichatus]|uniref:MauE/DoxX family redox-associated membrane protein n=1 Tax=Rubellicoccus peritrichatus TaxID=3080537 RepID=A0AAQ3QT33_9BACT|nr:MauE/DoxX family redox-associated membrane protein [Puniceicoccus sp. CR14]WOO43253.1 MauE/DoxX family redox-associated membrane protein [Puniceicoccus sp. CR14]
MAGFQTVTLWSLRIVMAGLFLYAGAIKVMSPGAFLADIESYRILPYQPSLIVALYLPFLEIALAIALLIPRWSRPSALILSAMLFVFLVAIISAWMRGLDISCGCFGKQEVNTNYPWLVIRDLLMLGASVWISIRSGLKDTPNVVLKE